MIGVITPQQFCITSAKRAAVRIGFKSHHFKQPMIIVAQLPTISARRATAKMLAHRIERIAKIRPARSETRIGCGSEGARLALPSGKGPLRLLDLLSAHPSEIIIAVVKLSHVIETKKLPTGLTSRQRSPKFTGLIAPPARALLRASRHPAVETLTLAPIALPIAMHRAYIGAMTDKSTGPVAAEITRRLTETLTPSHLAVIDDSHHHAGHSGHDARGESHFTVEIVSPTFEGQNRVARQRAINAALADLLADRVHALSIRAKAPSELP